MSTPLPTSLSKWLDTFEVSEARYIPVKDQEHANNLVRQVQAKSRRGTRTKNWRFACTTLLTMNVSDPMDQKLLLEVLALNEGITKNFTI